LTKIHESGGFLLNPLFVLVLGTVFIGFLFKDFFLGAGSTSFGNSLILLPSFSFLIEVELLSYSLKIFLFIFFTFIALGVYPYFIFKIIGSCNRFFNFFYLKKGFEYFYFFNFK
jgi:hypothetical protein